MFAFSLFLLAVALIPGASLWNFLRELLFGLFGFCGFVFPLILMYIAITGALERHTQPLSYKFMQTLLLVVLVCSCIHIFTTHPDGYWKAIGYAYTEGIHFSNGGALGALIGGILLSLFGKVGAGITVIILIFTAVMLFTGTTLLQLFHFFYTPIKSIEAAKENFVEDEPLTEEVYEDDFHEEHRGTRFDIDVSLGDELEDSTPKKEPREKLQPLSVSRKNEKQEEEEQKPVIIDDIVAKATMETKEPAVPAEPEEKAPVPPEEPVRKGYKRPSINLLNQSKTPKDSNISDELKNNATLLVDTLRSFGVETRIIDISRGPAVTRYELQPSAGVKISRITNLADDIALNLAATGVRIEAPIPGKAAVGIEVPNKFTSMVAMREALENAAFRQAKSKLTVALGKDIAGNVAIADLAKMPHVLIAGATGSGKSVCINSLIVSLLYKATPDEVKLVMIDPKVVELGIYNGIPHLLVPVVTDPRKAAGALGWAVTEMLNRYKIFADNNVRDIFSYNNLCAKQEELKPLPQVVIIIDELADLMMVAPNEVEDSICRLAQMARAAGMHLVIATQRPSVDVITGIIKANIPSRIAFSVSSQVDSRTILDMSGAEKLLGMGDMLFYPVGASKPTRIQGCFVSDKEIERIVDFVKDVHPNEYDDEVLKEIDRQTVVEKKKGASRNEEDEEFSDDMLPKAVECVIDAGIASTTLLQRKLRLGYARAARLIDELEKRGIVGPFEGSKPRAVLITKSQWLEMQSKENEAGAV